MMKVLCGILDPRYITVGQVEELKIYGKETELCVDGWLRVYKTRDEKEKAAVEGD